MFAEAPGKIELVAIYKVRGGSIVTAHFLPGLRTLEPWIRNESPRASAFGRAPTVHRRARRRGVGAALMRSAESAARDAGRKLLVLDTVTDSDAERLYTRLGWQRCGEIPGYALWPRGGYCSATVFCRVLREQSDN